MEALLSLLFIVFLWLLSGGIVITAIVLAIVFYVKKHKTEPLPPNQQSFDYTAKESEKTNMNQ